jgi:hypothetical protein
MVKIIIFWCIVLGLMMFTVISYAQNTVIVCETDKKGRTCCWDTNQYGPSRPWICS